MRKVSPYLTSSFLYILSQRYLLRLAALFFPNNMKGSTRTTTRFGHLCSSTTTTTTTTATKQQKDKKRYNLTIESLLPSNRSNRFRVIQKVRLLRGGEGIIEKRTKTNRGRGRGRGGAPLAFVYVGFAMAI